MNFQWINLYELAKVSGLVYFSAYVDSSTQKAIGWVSRAGVVEPYSYAVNYSDGTNQLVTTRGTFGNAQACIWGLQRHFAMAGGIPMSTIKLAAQQGWHVAVWEGSIRQSESVVAVGHGELIVVRKGGPRGIVLASDTSLFMALAQAAYSAAPRLPSVGR